MEADFSDEARPVRLSLISGRGHYETVLDAAMAARTSLWIATANLKGLLVETPGVGRRRHWRPVLEIFAQLAARGVELRILHSGFPSRAFREAFDEHEALVRGGLELRHCVRVHLKAVIVDGRDLYLGSANWTGAGLGGKGESRRNFELGVWTQDEGMLDRVQALYEHLWSGGECRTCGRRDNCDAPIV